MTGGAVIALATVPSGAAKLSHRVVWALLGVQVGADSATLAGFATMFDPTLPVMTNATCVAGICGCALICRDGQPGPDIPALIAMMRVRWWSCKDGRRLRTRRLQWPASGKPIRSAGLSARRVCCPSLRRDRVRSPRPP
jgi:hypothetical protein